jgi:hypothetical protein
LKWGQEVGNLFYVAQLVAVDGFFTEHLLDTEELVVFGNPVGTAHRTGLDLACIGRHGNVGDRAVLGLTGTVGNHGVVSVYLTELDGVERLSKSSDLVHLDQDGVSHAEIDSLLKEINIGDKKIVTDELHFVANLVGEDFPTIPVVLITTVFDGVDGVLLTEFREVSGLLFGVTLGSTFALKLSVVIDTVLEELG